MWRSHNIKYDNYIYKAHNRLRKKQNILRGDFDEKVLRKCSKMRVVDFCHDGLPVCGVYITPRNISLNYIFYGRGDDTLPLPLPITFFILVKNFFWRGNFFQGAISLRRLVVSS